MELIDKAVVVAEIERLYKEHSSRECIDEGAVVLDKLEDFIDTLEVKEVDLNNEIVDYINKHYHIRFDETLERGNDLLTTIDFEEIAKHFFELGLKAAQKGE